MKVMHLSGGFSTSGVTAGLLCMAKHGFYDAFEDFQIVGTSKGDERIFSDFEKCLQFGQVAFLTQDKASPDSKEQQILQGIKRQIDAFEPDALILSTSGAVINGRMVARDYPDLKVATFEHHTLSHLPEERKQLLRNTSSTNHIIFGDTLETIEITKQTLYTPSTMDVPSFVVPLTIPHFGSPRPSETISKYDVLSLGRLDSEKNYFELIHAAAILKNEGYAFHLTIGGKGNQHEELEKLAKELGLASYISLPGYLENPAALRSTAHIYIQPSLSEGLCLGFIEAAAAGMVIVGTDVGGMKDYGVDNDNMIKIYGFDRNAIAGGLRRAFNLYPTSASRLSNGAITMAAAHFGEDGVKRQWTIATDALKSLCNPKEVSNEIACSNWLRSSHNL